MHRNDLSQIMKVAHFFMKMKEASFSECLKRSWANYKLVNEMKNSTVRFYFKKLDGTVREAYGTLKDKEESLKSSNKINSDIIQVYFDIEKQQWRSFKKWNLIVDTKKNSCK